MLRPLLLLFLCLLLHSCGRPIAVNDAKPPSIEDQISLAQGDLKTTTSVQSEKPNAADTLIRPLIEPAKLATLGDRGANSRIQKITAILWQAKVNGQDPAKVADKAVELIGWAGTEKGRLTSAAMVRNLTILERLGSTTPADLDDMKHGKTATVRKGRYAGEVLSVDHIIPRAVEPELDNVIANLELMPLTVNRKKNDEIGERQVSMAKAFHAAGLLSDAGFQRVMAAKR